MRAECWGKHEEHKKISERNSVSKKKAPYHLFNVLVSQKRKPGLRIYQIKRYFVFEKGKCKQTPKASKISRPKWLWCTGPSLAGFKGIKVLLIKQTLLQSPGVLGNL